MGSVEQYHANQEQALLAQAKAAGILSTPTGLGGAREQILSDYLANHLPARLSVERGEVIDQNGRSSGETDLVLVDHESGALRVGGESIVPVEAATACLEIKSSLAGEQIELALRKTAKLKSLERTTHKGFFWTSDQAQQPRIEVPPRAPIVYVIAYDSPNLRTVLTRVNQNRDWYKRDYMRFGPDVIAVLGQGFAFKNDHHIYSHPSGWDVVVNDAEPGLFTILDHIQEYVRRYGNLTYEPW